MGDTGAKPLLSARCEWSAPQSRTAVTATEVGASGGRFEEKKAGLRGEQELGSQDRGQVGYGGRGGFGGWAPEAAFQPH